ncbi:MAG: glycosyltransferase family A protein [Chloroherpetonaceae bacterium]|nr:glycosyltransferase family A protein [Chloroherpetonaceae bacterium]
MKPIISVVIPTYNRAESLLDLLQTLQGQSLPNSDYEVIVVSDGSTDGTARVVRAMQRIMTNLAFFEQANSGPAAARNNGVLQAKGKFIAFTDDDCLASRDWLKEIVKTLETKPIIGIQGKTTTYKEEKTPLTHQIENHFGHPALPTCNAAFHKWAFQAVGGFDTSFPFAHNEDADLAWRIQALGEISFEPSVHIIHPPRKEAFSKLAKRMRILESEFLLFYKNQKLYQTHRTSSPWVTIYKEVFLIHLFRHLKSHFKYVARPRLFFQGVALNVVWWISLIKLFPKFRKAELKYQSHYKSS